MQTHISAAFSEDLHELDQMVVSLSGLAQTQLRSITTMMADIDQDIITTIIANDAKLDETDAEIFNKALQIIALRSPRAEDLRKVMVSPTIANNLERIGDYAKNIGKRLIKIKDAGGAVLFPDELAKLADLALGLVIGINDAYARSDAAKARSVWEEDVHLDNAYNTYMAKVLKVMDQGKCDAAIGSHCLFMAKNLERIGDHATGIAEQIHFRINAVVLDDDRPKAGDAEQ